MTTRRFSSRQRVALYMVSGGQCAECGAALAPGWHADHVQPWSQGGATDVVNGQALCPTCNRKKGNREMLMEKTRKALRPWTLDLWRWQEEALVAYTEENKDNFLIVAGVGSGKTLCSARITHYLLSNDLIDFVIVVVPTEGLKHQWRNDVWQFDKKSDPPDIGIALHSAWENGTAVVEPHKYHGIAVTYPQVASQPTLFADMCRKWRVEVILDEAHHLRELDTEKEAGWGSAAEQAFALAARRLLLSGTPFRSDGRKILWAGYECRDPADGLMAYGDYEYPYSRGVQEGVNRELITLTMDGEARFISGLEEVEATFKDELGNKLAARRYRTHIQPELQSVRRALQLTDERVAQLPRGEHINLVPGAIAWGDDQPQAKKIAQLLREISTDTNVSLVLSDDKDAQATLDAYKTGSNRWLVCVRMVSEGVDIPRLQVGVYLTGHRTETFFQQSAGRLLRATRYKGRDGKLYLDPEDQPAYLYIFADPQLIRFAQAMDTGRRQGLRNALTEMLQRTRENAEEGTSGQQDFFIPKSANADLDAILSGTVSSNGTLAGAIWRRIEEAKQQNPEFAKMSTPALIKFIKILGLEMFLAGSLLPAPAAQPPPLEHPQIRAQQKRQELTGRNGLVARIARTLTADPKQRGKIQQSINADVALRFGKRIEDISDPDEIQARIDYVTSRLQEGYYAKLA